MTSDEVYGMLQLIREEKSRNVKVEYLREFLKDSMFKRVVIAAYDFSVTYGVKKVTNNALIAGDGQFTGGTFELLKRLSTRALTGHKASMEIVTTLQHLTADSGKLFLQILNKDLRGGFNASSLNKAEPGIVITFPYMRCSLPRHVPLSDFSWSYGVISQLKADGLFVTITKTTETVTMNTRNGQPFDMTSLKMQLIVDDLHLPSGYQYHGELVVFRDGLALSRKASNGIINSVQKDGGGFCSNEEPFVFLWDAVVTKDVQESGCDKRPYATRLALLQDNLYEATGHIRLIETRLVKSQEEAQDHFDSMRSKGLEGTIIKGPEGIWKSGTSKQQVKLKAELDTDLRIAGFKEGKGAFKGMLGSLRCVTDDGKLEVYVSGFSVAMREEMSDNWADWLGELVCVRYNEVITAKNSEVYSLFLPRFVCKLHDKYDTDTIERILAQGDA